MLAEIRLRAGQTAGYTDFKSLRGSGPNETEILLPAHGIFRLLERRHARHTAPGKQSYMYAMLEVVVQ